MPPIDKHRQEITEISNIIGASSQAMSQGASTQAAAMEETASSLKEIFAKTKKNEEVVLAAQGLMAEETASVAEELVAMSKTIANFVSKLDRLVKS